MQCCLERIATMLKASDNWPSTTCIFYCHEFLSPNHPSLQGIRGEKGVRGGSGGSGENGTLGQGGPEGPMGPRGPSVSPQFCFIRSLLTATAFCHQFCIIMSMSNFSGSNFVKATSPKEATNSSCPALITVGAHKRRCICIHAARTLLLASVLWCPTLCIASVITLGYIHLDSVYYF